MADLAKKLIDQYNKPPKGDVRHIKGTVMSVETMNGMVVLHVGSGGKTDSFALALEALDNDQHYPLPGDFVRGTTNPLVDPVNIFGETHAQIFDFENVSGKEREASFKFFRDMKP
jgi:hypothetical protein